MGYSIHLVHPETKDTLDAPEPHHIQGSTCAPGGTKRLWLGITYNYAPHYYRIMGEAGIRAIYSMTGAESIPVLEAAIAQLGDDYSDNYWVGTEGNAKLALKNLVRLAKMRPDGVWKGD